MLAALVLASAVVLAGDEPPHEARTPRYFSLQKELPDEDYQPKAGDDAVMVRYDEKSDEFKEAEGATYSFAYHEYWKALNVKDYDGTDELRERGLFVRVAPLTSVLVLEVEHFKADDPRGDCAVVRVREGLQRGKKLWVYLRYVTQMAPNPNYEKNKAAKAAKDAAAAVSPKGAKAVDTNASPGDQLRAAKALEAKGNTVDAAVAYRVLMQLQPGTPEADEAAARVRALDDRQAEAKANAKAKQLVVLASNLEKAGKTSAALGYYRRILAECPKSPEAKKAAVRLKALEGFK